MMMKTQIKGIDKVEGVVGRWSPGDLAIIEDVKLEIDRDLSETNLTLTALFQVRAASWPNFEEEMYRVIIRFDDVGDLSLKNFGGGGVQIMGFDIHSVGDRGLEGINYKIEDYEDDRIRFNCRNVTVEVAANALVSDNFS